MTTIKSFWEDNGAFRSNSAHDREQFAETVKVSISHRRYFGLKKQDCQRRESFQFSDLFNQQ